MAKGTPFHQFIVDVVEKKMRQASEKPVSARIKQVTGRSQRINVPEGTTFEFKEAKFVVSPSVKKPIFKDGDIINLRALARKLRDGI